MAIQWVNRNIVCLQADVATLPTNIPSATQAWVTDVGRIINFNGTAWEGLKPSVYAGRTKVYKIGSTYYADKHDGSLISASGTFETVLQAALNVKGLVTIEQDGNFDFTSAGVSLAQETTLKMGPATKLRPPSSSLNFVAITVGGTGLRYSNHIEGGIIEKASVTKNWYGIALSSGLLANGVLWNTIKNVRIVQPYVGVRLITSSTGWVNANTFENIVVDKPIVGFEFINGGSNGMDENVFNQCEVQNDTNASLNDLAYGFQDVQRKGNSFNNCKVWDLPVASQKTMTIAAGALNTAIRGGMIADPAHFLDNSTTRSTWIEPNERVAPTHGDHAIIDSIFVPFGRRNGSYHPLNNGTIGSGLWNAGMPVATGQASSVYTIAYADGTIFNRFTSGAVSGNGAGNRFNAPFTCRGWNPIYKIKFRLAPTGTTTNLRLFFGFTTTGTDPTGDDPLSALSGVILCLRAADTTYQIAANDGTGATTFTSTGVSKGTGITTFELTAVDNATNKFKWSINNGAWTNLTDTNIPAQGTGLFAWNQIQTAEAAAKSVDIFGVYVETN